MAEKNQDELFHREIDVAEIMREVKQKALNMSCVDMSEEGISEDAGANLFRMDANLNRISEFITNTLKKSESYIEMGAIIPIGTRWKGLFRKLILLLKRLIRKATRFLVEDQLQFNQMSNQNIRALMEGQEQLRQAIVQMHQQTSGKIDAVHGEIDDSIVKWRGLAEQIHVFEQIYQKWQEDAKKSTLDEKLYKEYEDRYRGSEEDIKGRLSYYLPYIANTVRNQQKEPVLDLGCGRGEWMELLRENHYEVSGVDFNKSMVERCKEKGLNASCGDAIAYLKQLPDCSVKVVTGFQFAEHLKAGDLAELIAEAYRVLMFHGILILELPNCRNVEVGSSGFYSDPTHIRPVTSDYLEFVAQNKGFYETKTVYWKQQEIDNWLDGVIASDETKVLESPVFRTILASLKQTHYTAPDYALVATK